MFARFPLFLALTLNLAIWPLGALAVPSLTGQEVSHLRAYSEWKSDKIHAAKEQLQETQAKMSSLKDKLKPQDPLLKVVDQQVSQDQWNVEITEDLTVTDYLVLYLASNKSAAKYKEAAAKLSAEDTAQILEAYVKVVQALQDDKKTTKLPRRSGDLN